MTTTPYLPQIMSDVVVDLSHYQTVSENFSITAAAGIAAVILKATQGTGFIDPTFLPRVAEARAAGLLVGAYHFLDGSNPAQQVANFLTIAKSEGGVDWLAVDWEPYPSSQASVIGAAQAVASVQAATGSWPILYTIRYMLSAPNTTLSRCPLWLAEYGSSPVCPPGWTEWNLWQHTDGQIGSGVAPVPGIGPCDRRRFAGTIVQLGQWRTSPTPYSFVLRGLLASADAA
jgi:lysozyme